MTTKLECDPNFKLLVVIPVFNCETQIVRTLKQFQNTRLKISEVLVIDNLSTDDSLRQAELGLRQLKNLKTKLFQNSQNIGLGGSHQVAFRYGLKHQFSHLLILHGDDQASLKDFETVLTPENLQLDAVLGSRFMTGARLINYSWIRRWGNLVLNQIFSGIVGQTISDTGSGLNLYNLASFSQTAISSFPRDLTFNIYLLLWSLDQNQQLKFWPISWREVDQVSQAKVWQQGFKILQVLRNFKNSPKRFFSQLAATKLSLPQPRLIFEKNS